MAASAERLFHTPTASSASAAPLEVLILEGDGRARGAALKERMSQDAARAALPFYAGFLPAMLRARHPTMSGLWVRAIEVSTGLLLDVIARRQDPELRAAIDALADGEPARVKRLARRAHATLDLVQLLVGRVPGAGRAVQAHAACSSAIVFGPATVDGRLLHGRNFDLSTPDVATTSPLLQVHRPSGGGLAHVSVFHRPAFAPGVTALNEAGIGVSIHTHFTRDAGLFGTPVLSMARAVIESARTLGQAVDAVRAHHPICGWSFYLSDARARQAAAVEIGHKKAVVRDAEDGVVYGANEFLDPEMNRHEVTPADSFRAHNRGRLQRLRALLEGRSRAFDAAALAAVLGDGVDPEVQSPRAMGGSISAPYNVLSVIYAFEADRLYVGRGGVPASCGQYDGLSFSRLLERGEIATGETLLPALDDAGRSARHALAKATAAWGRGVDRATALTALDEACDHAPDDPSLRLARAILRLPNDADGAQVDLAHAAHLRCSPLAAAHRDLLAGWSADLRGRRTEAETAYRAALESGVDEVAKAARRGLRRPFTRRDASKIAPDLHYGGIAL
jgi:hypothetical protein